MTGVRECLECMSDHPTSFHDEYPPKADLRQMMAEQPLPSIAPGLLDPDSITSDESALEAHKVLSRLNDALAADDAEMLEKCFFSDQAYWKDELALTYHLRTFTTARVITAALLETEKLRGITGDITIDGEAKFISATPTLQFIDCPLAFWTKSPAATCRGRMVLLPVGQGPDDDGEDIDWKIWMLSTSLVDLDVQHEDEGLLQSPARQFDPNDFDTDVFIIGGGNAAISLAARLKALGVESVMAERNAQPGDNWTLRYDCMRFHTPTSYCTLPYMPYDKELQSPHFLKKNELASHVRRYVETFNLNIINSAHIQSTRYSPFAKRWMIEFMTPAGQRTAFSKHLVLATGIGAQKVNMPQIADSHLYKGISVHSAQYQNANQLMEQGAKSALVIGSANTAFDVLEDCHAAGLQTTMVARSPPYLIPVEYISDKRSVGAYDIDVAAADRNSFSLPLCVISHLDRDLLLTLAAQEPDRYTSLEAAGFPVLDSRHPDACLFYNLLERAGGHYVDVGGTKLLAEGKASLKAGVEPIAYTTTGLRFSDGSCANADAIIWCTGFADKDIRDTAIEILECDDPSPNEYDDHDLDPPAIAARLDATWGIDSEGEVRGMWKRHLFLDDNFWIMGGYTQQHRWHSRTVALQIKAELEGVLPPAYRDTPLPRGR